MKFEAARIHFLGDVFDAYSSLLSKKKKNSLVVPFTLNIFCLPPPPIKNERSSEEPSMM